MKLLADEIDMEKQGFERGVRQGMKQGKEQGVLQVAKELKANGVSMEIIMKTTHLTQDQIEKL